MEIPFINIGYRAHPRMGLCKCSSTALMMHNETMNFWTHAIPTIYFLAHIYLSLTGNGIYGQIKSQNNLYIMALGGLVSMFAMFTSALYHLYYIMGPKIYENLLKLDLMGIGVGLFGFGVSLTYTAFHNYPVTA